MKRFFNAIYNWLMSDWDKHLIQWVANRAMSFLSLPSHVIVTSLGVILGILWFITPPTFYFASNVIAGMIWGMIFYLYAQSESVPQSELPVIKIYEGKMPSVKQIRRIFFYRPMPLERLENTILAFKYLLTGATLFFIFHLDGRFWGYPFGEIESIWVIAILGALYLSFSELCSLIFLDFATDYHDGIGCLATGYILGISLFMALDSTQLTFSGTPFFIVAWITRVGLTFLKFKMPMEQIQVMTVRTLVNWLCLVPLITVLFLLT